jgi:hypothetical protein
MRKHTRTITLHNDLTLLKCFILFFWHILPVYFMVSTQIMLYNFRNAIRSGEVIIEPYHTGAQRFLDLLLFWVSFETGEIPKQSPFYRILWRTTSKQNLTPTFRMPLFWIEISMESNGWRTCSPYMETFWVRQRIFSCESRWALMAEIWDTFCGLSNVIFKALSMKCRNIHVI